MAQHYSSIKFTGHFFVYLLLLTGLLGYFPGKAQETAERVVMSYGVLRSLPKHFLGINSETVNPASSREMLAAFEAANMAHLRYPGGGVANYWDWGLGWIKQDLDENRLLSWMYGMQASPERFTLEHLVELNQKTGTSILFVLNMVTDDLESQIAHLKHAEALGIPIERIELGNELYLDIESYVLEVYPTVAVYAQEAGRWAAALKAAFPQVQIAVVGAARAYAPPNSRTGTWNRQLFPLLSDDIDAVAEHVYIDSGVGPRVGPNGTGWGTPAEQQAQYSALHTLEGIRQLLSRPFKAWQDFQLFSQLSEDREMWMTEFNLFDWNGPARGTWANGLLVGGFLHNFLMDERVTLATYHSLAGGPLFPAVFPHEKLWGGLTVAEISTPPYQMSASGFVLSLLGDAMNNMDTATPLIFTPNTLITVPLSVPYPALWGWSFRNSDSYSLILVNYAAEAVEVDITAAESAGLPYRQIYTDPAAYVLGYDSLMEETGTIGAQILLHPYSITMIKS